MKVIKLWDTLAGISGLLGGLVLLCGGEGVCGGAITTINRREQ